MVKKEMKESQYYEKIKVVLQDLLKDKFKEIHLEITAQKKFSNILKSEITKHGHRDIIFRFLKEAAPDITGFIKDDSSSSFIVVEVKKEIIKLDNIYQTKKYADLFDAKYALLISIKEIPDEIKRLSKVIPALLSLNNWRKRFVLIHFNYENKELIDWYPENPFLNY